MPQSSAAQPSAAQSDLFDPVQLGPYKLANRIVMAPLTRSRADDAGVPGELQATYYAQRASAGLIITEATNISAQGKGYIRTPGIWTPEQVEGWKLTTKAVHAKGGRIFLQLWHVGRVSHPDLQPGGVLPVAPSAVRAEGQQAYTYDGFKPLETPRALETAEIAGIVADYAHAAQCAKDAGFDGVEIHSANGYLLQQFLSDKTNKRTDQYGGSIENRTRIVVEVVAAVTKVWGGDRVGIRLVTADQVRRHRRFKSRAGLSVADRADQSVQPRLHPRHRGRHWGRTAARRRLRSAEAAPGLQRPLHGQQQL